MSKLNQINPAELATNKRATFDAWKRYESIVLAAVRQHPRPYVFEPTSMAASTVVSRLRDAIKGKLAFDYPSSVSTSDLLRWWDKVIVRQFGDKVYIGPRVSAELPAIAASPTPTTALTFSVLSFEDVNAFAHLLSRALISGPVHVINPPDLSLLPERPNVILVPQTDGSLLLM